MAYEITKLIIRLAVYALVEFLVFKYVIRNRKGLVFILKDFLAHLFGNMNKEPAAE